MRIVAGYFYTISAELRLTRQFRESNSPLPRAEEARRMGRGPRMDPQLYQELRARIPALSTHAVHMTIPAGTSPTTMKNRILRVAAALRIPVTVRKVSGGLLFWHSTDEDVRQAKEVVDRLQSAQRRRRVRPGRRRRG